jgi:hypothetical protein
MTDGFSWGGLVAGMLPERYAARYLENLSVRLNSVVPPGATASQPLDRFYVPLQFYASSAASNSSVDRGKSLDAWDLLFRAPRLVLIGEPGSGKSTTLRQVGMTLASHKMPETYVRRLTFLHVGQAQDQLLPVYVDAGSSAGDARCSTR